ncbi:mycothiol synthase [Williamsia sterculiae]|uniref:Mycothiol acetyltransferase n=1 Tax=Williamsia sterculiae TaxID=1344003 RepID=A0A1N7GX76_9NOCA|nr:mycothiol synthase [Williamsia sterculiae]SIS17174.1 mycothiol synthase [Williamsia sterculiae]
MTALDPEIVARVREILAAADDFDGVAALSEQAVLAVDGDRVAHVLQWTSDGVLVGYANITPGDPPMIEAVVDPAFRGHDHGRALLASALDVEPGARAWAHGNLPSARGLAAALGATVTRELLQLRRPLGARADPLPELQIPDDVLLTTFAEVGEDRRDHVIGELVRVNNLAFAWHPEQGGWSSADIDERLRADWFDAAGLFLTFEATDPDRLLGFHWTKVHPPRSDDPAVGEVYIVGVDPDTQGRGLGRLLTLAGLRHLADLGLTAVELYVEGDNSAALHTYDRLGFTRYAVDVAYGLH